MRFIEARLNPYERPENRTLLQERLERRQLSRLSYLMTPDDCWGLGLELTSGSRFILWSTRNLDGFTGHSKYRWRLPWRWIPPQKIVTRRLDRYFGYGRDSGLGTAVTPHLGLDLRAEEADELQKRVEGEFIAGASPTYEPNPQGGERVVLEFKGGGKLQIDAIGPRPGDRTCQADLDVQWQAPPERTHIWMPGLDT